MKRTIFFSIILISLLSPGIASAQSILERRANAWYENLSFSRAASTYESLYRRDPQNGMYIKRLAYCYDKMLNYKKALLYYSYLVQIDERSLSDYYTYAQLLRIDGNSDESKKWLEKYIQLAPDDKRAINQYKKLTELISIKNQMKEIEIKEVEGNTRFTDMCPAFYNKRIVYSSAKDSFSMIRNEFKWNGQPFLKLYETDINPKSNFKASSSFSKKLNSRVHEGPVCFTSDFKTIYFTRNSTTRLNNKKSPNRVNNLKIFISRYDGKDWSEPESFPYNSNIYSIGHPALSPDNMTLYFISDMQGGYGGTDLYKSQMVNGQWSKPENLGATINTEGREMFPFVDKEGILYFSSDGRPGMGGLDIYAAQSNRNGQYVIEPFNSPLNSTYDDFGLILNNDSLSGYFTSNRPGGMGDDDVYSFRVSRIDLQVTTRAENNNKILPDTKVYLKTENGEIISSAISDKDGLADFFVNPGQHYQLFADNGTSVSPLKLDSIPRQPFGLVQKEQIFLRQDFPFLTMQVIDKETGLIIPLAILDISEGKYDLSAIDDAHGIIRMKMNNSTDYTFNITAEGYFPKSVKYSTVGKDADEYTLTIAMQKLSSGKQFTLENLYYDLNKSDIRPDAALVLNDLAEMLHENPEVRIEINSHTDSRASADYNMKLSQRRSESVVEYLIGKGIVPDRLVAKGFGETQLINKCADGIDCPEEIHQANRRTVIEILNTDRVNKNVYYL
ncbi:MAG TPA: hypothetical protein DCL77_19380 [Prolixibacteraceae bacterium]|jgi:outer membrane protein OmpA-like peptidoglycan-associated protein|nr:hypothetical protein [Prolixibacteraceae bacterium]